MIVDRYLYSEYLVYSVLGQFEKSPPLREQPSSVP